MLRFLVRVLLLAAAPAVVAQSAPEFSGCSLRVPGTALEVQAQCATLEVPENPQQPQGRTLSLRIARIEASRPRERVEDPLYFLAGGPGQAATEAWPFLAPALRQITRSRDVILVDQRGTGGSHRLACALDDPDAALDTRFDAAMAREQARDCLATLDADTRFYTTALAADDLERVRRALGHGPINLLGVSYGTRLAQVFLRRHPDSVRRVILDGVVPPSLVLGTEHAPNLDAALAAIFARCAAEESCRAVFPDPQEQLSALRRLVLDESPQITLPLPASGTRETIAVTPDLLAMGLRLLSYASETQALLPLVLARATAGDWQPLVAQALMMGEGLQEQLAHGMELSVLCTEDVPFYPEGLDQGDTLLGNLMVEALRAQCEVWPVEPVSAEFHEPREQHTPVLLLSGELDPVTPPAYGEQALAQFPRGAHWVVPGRAHGVLRHGCLARLAGRFLDGTPAGEIDNACVQEVRPNPFFVDMTGPLP